MAAWKKWLNSRPFEWQFRPTQAGIEALRRRLLALLDDCDGFEVGRLRWRLHTAESAQELWLLREGIFQVVARQHCQAQAIERINALVPAFRSLLPARALSQL